MKPVTARQILFTLLAEIKRGPFSISQVCITAGVDPSTVSRWKSTDIEPKLSSIERLVAAHNALWSTMPPDLGRDEWRLNGRPDGKKSIKAARAILEVQSKGNSSVME